ncbi:ATP-binding protein [Neptuniibacter caesariensis]|uniref:AAA+ ATPase domain-containing protein n=1 Tax=Neptuniibacter caesariensis TaxID=207954 RepID=A0A7U8C428_NEPCE|nr:ATP-binding protein [Neptuniibacter caesariensis]EAR60406.1 hypothetical protein MED92_01039 [Oceanospirillum sp. MED92] [Neptuniibacter caesariensis]
MYQENQPSAENNQGSNQQEDSFTGPYRHKGYKRALEQLRDGLTKENAVILKGVEGTGKSTLIAELVSEYEHKGVPVAVFRDALPKAAHFYAVLAETLGVPKQKNDLVRALRNTKEAGQFCFVVVDQEAINSSPEVENALKQLCIASETTAGAIKLVVIRKDYLVIHTDGTPEADFHNWINQEVTLDPLHTDDIEGYIYYLSAIKGIQPTPYEIGTDFLMIEKTEGRISRLKALLLPLIHKDVITRKDIQGLSKPSVKVPKNNTAIFAVAFLVLLVAGVGLNHFILSDNSVSQQTVPSEVVPVFANNEQGQNLSKITPPSLSSTPAKTETSSIESSVINTEEESSGGLDSLPQLNTPEVVADSVSSSVKADPTSSLDTSLEITQEQTVISKASPAAGSLSEAEFQNEVKNKLELIEQQLNDAIAENKRLKTALAEAQQAKVLAEDSNTTAELAVSPGDNVVHTEQQPLPELAVVAGNETTLSKNSTTTRSEDTGPVTEDKIKETVINSELPKQVLVDTEQKDEPLIEKAESIHDIITETSRQQLTEVNKVIEQPLTDLEKATRVISEWQAAWQNQNHADYVAQYITGFNGAYKTHQQWLKKRHTALNKPNWIKLTRSDFIKTEEANGIVKIDFWLTYEADNGYKDKTHKRLTLEFSDDRWLISKEQNIKVQPFF